jgi:hypothetical protein
MIMRDSQIQIQSQKPQKTHKRENETRVAKQQQKRRGRVRFCSGS